MTLESNCGLLNGNSETRLNDSVCVNWLSKIRGLPSFPRFWGKYVSQQRAAFWYLWFIPLFFYFFFFSITICAHGRVTDHKVKVVVCSAHGLDVVFAGVYSPPKHFKCIVDDLWAALSSGCSQNATLLGLFFTLTFENLSRDPVWSQLLNHNCNLPSQLLSCNADICSSHGKSEWIA